MKDKVEFKKMREFGDIIGDTFLFIKQNFIPLLKAFFYLTGVFIIAGMASSIITQLELGSLTRDKSGIAGMLMSNSMERLYQLALNYVFVVVFMMLMYTSMYVSILSYIALYIKKGNEAPTVTEVWGYYKYYFFRVLGSGVLMSIFLFLCFMCCILPGIFVFPAVSLFYAIMILENASFSYSFGRSFKLLSGEWWTTAASLLIIYIIFYACTLVVQLPAVIITMASAFSSKPGAISRSYVFITSISSYASLVFMIIPVVCSALLYFDLVERKESLGLLSRIEDLGKED